VEEFPSDAPSQCLDIAIATITQKQHYECLRTRLSLWALQQQECKSSTSKILTRPSLCFSHSNYDGSRHMVLKADCRSSSTYDVALGKLIDATAQVSTCLHSALPTHEIRFCEHIVLQIYLTPNQRTTLTPSRPNPPVPTTISLLQPNSTPAHFARFSLNTPLLSALLPTIQETKLPRDPRRLGSVQSE